MRPWASFRRTANRRGIRLRSQTVNAVITEAADGVWADTDLQVQLQNRGKTPIVVPVGLPGPQPAAYVTTTLGLPEIYEVTLDKKPLALVPLGPGERPGIRASAVITVPEQGTVSLRVRYRQAVPVRDDLAAYVYPLASGNVWAGAPESLSVLLTFKRAVSREQVMFLTPGWRTPRPGAYAWGWSGAKASSNAAAVFVTNRWWQELEAARAAAAGSNSGLAEHAALAEHYWRLATLAPPAFAPGASFYDRAFPLAVAAWRAGLARAGATTPPADLARAHERLAGLYLAEGNRAGGAAAQTYLQLAADEMAAGVALDPGNEELASSASALEERLAAGAANRGDGMLASAHSARLAALAAGQYASTSAQVAQQQALALAEAAVTAGDLAGARHLLAEAYGPEVLQVTNARPPLVTQSIVHVKSRPAGREISLRLVGGSAGSATGLVEETAAALRRVAPVTSAADTLTVTLAYTDPAALIAAQGRLAAALPHLPELALLSSALSTRRLAWPEQANLVSRTSRYEERVDLTPSVAAWDAEAAKLEAAAVEATGVGGPLDRLRAALWRARMRGPGGIWGR